MVKDSKIDKVMIVSCALLLMLGLIMIYSSTSVLAKEQYGDNFHFLKRQVVWLLVGLIIATIISSLKYPYYLDRRIIFVVITVAIFGLILVFFSGRINNTYRWIRFGGFPSNPLNLPKLQSYYTLPSS